MLSKKKRNEIDRISCFQDVLVEYGETWVNNPPDEWGKHERQLFDMLNEVEMRTKKQVIEIIK